MTAVQCSEMGKAAASNRWKPYPVYEPSGIEWLGNVPEHWPCRPLRYLAWFINGAPFKPDDWADEGTPIIRIENLNGGASFNCYPHPMPEKYHVGRGALLFGWSGNRGTSFGPFLWWRDGLHYLNQHIFRVAGFRSDTRWFYWALKAVTYYVEKQAHGIIGLVHVTKGDLGSIKMTMPPPPEQRAIADFLDRETAKIDTLVAKKRELIEKLKEKRTALNSHAVTRGLDPNAKLKPSGIEWLGEVPEHWAVSRIKFIVTTPVTDGPHETPEMSLEGIPFVSAEAICNGRIDFAKIRGFISEESHRTYSRKYCPKMGDIYMVKSGATTGRIAMAEDDRIFNIWSPLAAMRCSERLVDRRFVYQYLQCREFQTGVQLSWSYGTQQNIGMGVIQNLALPLPALAEQLAIADFLDRETAKIDALVAKVETAIEKLREYRTALITAAVTGKIDVRKAVA